MKSNSFSLKVILSLLVILSSCALIFAQTNKDEDDTLSVISEDYRFNSTYYIRGGWIFWNGMSSDTLLNSWENAINTFLEQTYLACPISFYKMGELKPSFLSCDLFLICQLPRKKCSTSNEYSTLFFIKRKNSDYLNPLGRLSFDVYPFWKKMPHYIYSVGREIKREKVDSSQVLAIAEDIVTFGSPVLPIIILNDIYEVYEFSNSLYDDSFWERTDLKDSIMTTLGSFRLKDIRDTKLFLNSFQEPWLDSTEFIKYSNVVSPPRITRSDSSSEDFYWIVNIFTWSPVGGQLLKWKIFIAHKDCYISHELEVIAEDIGLILTY